jgi:hypothetical protein
MTIRDFSPLDAGPCLEIRRQAFINVFGDELGADGIRAGLSIYGPSDLIRMSEHGKSFVAEDDVPIGFCTLQRGARNPKRFKANVLTLNLTLF